MAIRYPPYTPRTPDLNAAAVSSAEWINDLPDILISVFFPQKCTYQIPNRTLSSFFFDCGFFSGCTFAGKLQVPTSTIQFLWWGLPIQAFLGPGWGEVLILSELICKYLHVQLSKKNHTSEHPLQDLRPDVES